jgi:hypothetical protein
MTHDNDSSIELARTRCALRVLSEAARDMVDLLGDIEVPEARRAEVESKLATLSRKIQVAADLRFEGQAESTHRE